LAGRRFFDLGWCYSPGWLFFPDWCYSPVWLFFPDWRYSPGLVVFSGLAVFSRLVVFFGFVASAFQSGWAAFFLLVGRGFSTWAGGVFVFVFH